MLGFDQREIAIMAATALFHRKASPGVRYPLYAQLDRPTARRCARWPTCCAWPSASTAATAPSCATRRCVADGRRALELRLATNGPAQLELWGLENRRASMEKAMGRRLSVEIETSARRGRSDA